MHSRIWRIVVLTLVLSVLVAGASMIFAAKPPTGGCPQPKPGCFCPTIYDPVICNGDCVYSNSCFARCAGARGCQSMGGGPVPL
jgi:hypothetical protein